MSEVIETSENTEAVENTEAAENVGEKVPEIIESMDDYKEELEASLVRLHRGDVMECTVVAVDEEAVSVDLDYYAPGKIPAAEYSEDPSFSIMTDVQVGETFKAVIIATDDGGGNILLSKKEADAEFAWEKLEALADEDATISGKIVDTVKAGAIMYVEGIRGFIPASRLSTAFVEDTSAYLGKKMDVKIVEVDAEDGKLILSARELLAEKELARKAETASQLLPGTVVTGTVESLKDYGAFVDIGDGLTGLLHISEISRERIKHPKVVLKEGQKVKVMILKTEGGKISLSMKAVKDQEEAEAEKEAEETAAQYHSEYVPNTPFAALLKNLK